MLGSPFGETKIAHAQHFHKMHAQNSTPVTERFILVLYIVDLSVRVTVKLSKMKTIIVYKIKLKTACIFVSDIPWPSAKKF